MAEMFFPPSTVLSQWVDETLDADPIRRVTITTRDVAELTVFDFAFNLAPWLGCRRGCDLQQGHRADCIRALRRLPSAGPKRAICPVVLCGRSAQG